MKRQKALTFPKVLWLACLVLTALLPAGCWNYRDLTDLNIVSAIGVELTEENKVLVTVQVVEQGGAGPAGGKEDSRQPATFVQAYEGDTVLEALRGILSTVDKKLFTSTAQVLILEENVCRQGLEDVLDFFRRDHEIDYRMDVLVARDTTPGELLAMETDIDPISGLYIKGTVENSLFRGTVKRTRLIDLLKELPGDRELVVGEITKIGEKRVRAEGAAVFKGGKLVGRLGPEETRGYLFVVNQIVNPVIPIHVNEGIVAFEIKHSRGKIGVEFSRGEPSLLTVDVELDAYVGEQKGETGVNNLDLLAVWLGEEIKKEIALALAKAQQDYGSDIFGFGAQLHKNHPEHWARLKDAWNETFSQLPAEIRVSAKIRRTGNVTL